MAGELTAPEGEPAMAVKMSELTKEQQWERFIQWQEKREQRQGTGQARSKARKTLMKKYPDEMATLTKAALKDGKRVELTDEQKAKILVNYVERKMKGKAKATARTRLINAHKEEFDGLKQAATAAEEAAKAPVQTVAKAKR